MAKIKLTKGELKRQRDSLEQFRHYLPTLQLKKQQFQVRILESKAVLAEKESVLRGREMSISRWIGLLADPCLAGAIDLKPWLIPRHEDVLIETTNIAGAEVPFLKEIRFKEGTYDLYTTPDRKSTRLNSSHSC